jgi:hypothetical protein
MHIVACACVRNEIDIVEAFVRHTLSFAERLFVLDHGSTDATPHVLRALVAEGLPLVVQTDATPGKYQSARMTALMHEAAASTGGSGWLFLLDVDEFLQWPEAGPIPADHAADRPLAVPWRTFVPHPDDYPAERNIALRMRHCRVAPSAEQWKLVVPAALAASPTTVIGQGSHHLYLDGAPIGPVACERLHLAHFPVRTPGQLLAKIAVGELQYRAMADRDAGWGWHTRSVFRDMLGDPTAAAARFAEAARRYGLDDGVLEPPVVCAPADSRGEPLRHTPSPSDADRAFLAVLGLASQFADHVAARGAAPPDEIGRIRTLNDRMEEEATLARQRGAEIIRLTGQVRGLAERIAQLEAARLLDLSVEEVDQLPQTAQAAAIETET